MWEEKITWNVSWSGVTIWGNDYNDSKAFDDERSAAEFCVMLSLKDDVDYIGLKKFTIWRKKRNV